MTRIIHLGSLLEERLAFNYSALHETVRSLQVLTRSKLHPLHLPWVLHMRQRMSPTLKTELAAFGILFDSTIPGIFSEPLHLSSTFLSFTEEFQTTQNLSPTDYAEKIINHSILNQHIESQMYSLAHIHNSAELQQHIFTQVAARHPASTPMIEELLTNPAQSHTRFLNFFSHYWETCIQPEWPQQEELLVRDIQHRGHILFDQGPLALLRSLAPQLHVYQENDTTTMQYPSSGHVEMQTNNILFLVPSAYVWPRLSFMFEEHNLIALVYSINKFHDEGLAPIAPERLLKLLKAAGDTTRLQILRLLSQRARSTQEIAGILGLSEAGISKHIKILQDAGFLKAERSSYYVLYHSTNTPIEEITRGLEEVLREE